MLPQAHPMHKQIYCISVCPTVSGISSQAYLQQIIPGRSQPQKMSVCSYQQKQQFFMMHPDHRQRYIYRAPYYQSIPRYSHVDSVLCGKCNIAVKVKDIQAHSVECEFMLHSCKGCKQMILKKYLKQHEEICELIELKCPQCTQIFTRKNKEQHCQVDCLKNGQRVLFNYKTQMSHENTYLKQDIDALKVCFAQLHEQRIDEIVNSFIFSFFFQCANCCFFFNSGKALCRKKNLKQQDSQISLKQMRDQNESANTSC